MKPEERDGFVCDNLIAQLRLLILKGRITRNTQSNIEDDVELGFKSDVLSRDQKEDFLSLWKTSGKIFIEVWLHCCPQFIEQEALQGQSGYLFLEQWHIEMKHNSDVGSGFHCTEKMLIQAINSKLYFSQLSAWLNITKGTFPKFTYLRLCCDGHTTPFKRFFKPPEFHQFPKVIVSPSRSIQVSLHSLPRFDIFQEYPMVTWLLDGQPAETPRIPSVNQGTQNGAKDKNMDSVTTKTARKLDYSTSIQNSLQVDLGSTLTTRTVATGNQFKIFEDVKSSVSTCIECPDSADNISENLLTSRKYPECKDFSERLDDHELFSSCVRFKHDKDNDLFKGHSESCNDNELTKPEQKKNPPTNLGGSDKEYDRKSLKVDSCRRCRIPEFREQMKLKNETNENFYSYCCQTQLTNTRTFPGHISEKSGCKTPCDRIGNKSCSQRMKAPSQVVSYHNFTPTNDKKELQSTIPRVKDKSSCVGDYKRKHCKKCGSLEPNCMCDKRKHFKAESKSEIDLRAFHDSSGDNLWRQTKSKVSEACRLNVGELSQIRSFDQDSNVLRGMEKGIQDILPGMTDVFEKECSDKIKEKLLKCSCSARICDNTVNMEEKLRKFKQMSGINMDSVFDDRCSILPRHTPLRFHTRHASTGTLPVFHPRTGLPISSSPAPLRKSTGLDTVDDTHSSTSDTFDLDSLSNVLSKSAPTLTAQKLLGNFEESVLNDRLLPDGVVEGFTAELSASGSTKCLAHVTLPVQAYFFKLSDDNAPSPYMGYISLNVPHLPRKGYHVPKSGTIQLTLFNPNQTVVKVFFVLYNFSDMKPNFQTFLRQKTTTYVKSDAFTKIIKSQKIINSRFCGISIRDVVRSWPTIINKPRCITKHDNLHYLIHLRFASSKSGRIYLHTDIRLIFCRHPPDAANLLTSVSGPTDPKYVPKQNKA